MKARFNRDEYSSNGRSQLAESSDQNSDISYFKSYENLDVHRLMLSDRARTDAYRKAILENRDLFAGKVVLDVGSGTGILSLFAAEAGASKVHAIEASNIALLARQVVQQNGFDKVIEVSSCPVEDFMLPDGIKADVIISEWMGFYLLHESMLNSVIFARDSFLKESGVMFPCKASIYACPSTLKQFYQNEIAFWDDVYGYNFSAVKEAALQSKLQSPEIILACSDELICKPELVKYFDLKTITLEDVKSFGVKFFTSSMAKDVCRGVVMWFDCEFPSHVNGQCTMLSTGPDSPPTHWKQTVVVLPGEMVVEDGDVLGFDIELTQSDENSRRYNIKLEVLGRDVEHPVPCGCGSARCTLIKAFLEKQAEEEMTPGEDQVLDISGP